MNGKYEEGDVITCYFVVEEDRNHPTIRGWSDRKDLVKAYLEFHKCKKYRIKKMTDVSSEIMKVLEENWNDEIDLYYIQTKDKHGELTDMIAPLTSTEKVLISGETTDMMSSRVNYGYINDAMYYLKNRYQKAFKQILLKQVIDSVVYSKNSNIIQNIGMDELNVLLYSMPDKFGV